MTDISHCMLTCRRTYRFGRPDVQNSRDYDVSFTLKMSSILYVHTHRFMSELVAFVQHFEQLQDVRGRERAESAGHQVTQLDEHLVVIN